MLKKLQIKFVAIAMAITLVVLVAIIGGINVNNFVRVGKNADKTISLLVQGGGKFSIPDDMQKPTPDDGDEPAQDETSDETVEAEAAQDTAPEKPSGDMRPPEMSPETPFETRYFTVTMDEKGQAVLADTDRIAAVDEDTAKAYAAALFASGKEKGYKGDYRYARANINGKTTYIFVDCTRDLDTARNFLKVSGLVSLGGYIVVFVLVIVFSKVALKPVAETYKKQKQFITDANHELKTPLTVIGASCEMLEYENGENEWTTTINEQVEKLTELTNKLVFLSRMDEESKKTVMSEFSLSEVVEEAVKPYYALCSAQNKSLEVSIAPNVSYTGDVKMIGELIALLMDNAVKYSSKEGNIRFSLESVGKAKKIVVTNATDGVPKGDLSMLFERFYRLDASRNSETGGHGIGLSVAKAIVELHKGKITANSPDGNEIVFEITL